MKPCILLLSALIFAAQTGCNKNNDTIVELPVTDTIKPPVIKPDSIPVASYNLSLLTLNLAFSDKPTVTTLANQQYQEISGIAPSHQYPGRLYMHEDSGNSNEVYMTDMNGNDLGKLVLDGLKNRDWEDITTGPGPIEGKNYIYIAEIGDNKATATSIFVYRFIEPNLPVTTAETTLHITAIDKIELSYPKGAVNAETLLIDPHTKDLYIATKQQQTSTVYLAAFPQSVSSKTMLKPIAKLPFDLLTSGSISTNGSELLLRSTGQIWYWKRKSGETILQMLLRAPEDAPYFQNERQGEAIDFSADGSGYCTISEIKGYAGEKNAITFYKRN